MFLMPYVRPITESNVPINWFAVIVGAVVLVAIMAGVLFAFSYRPAKETKPTTYPGRLHSVS
jgi:hypothetical protein